MKHIIDEQLKKEVAEVDLITAIKQWRQVGLGDEHLVDVILASHPSLILNFKARFQEEKICTTCYDPICLGEYTHFENPLKENI